VYWVQCISKLYLRYLLVVDEYRYMYVGLRGYIFKFTNKKKSLFEGGEDALYVGEFIYFFSLYLMIWSEMCRVEWLGVPVYWISIWKEAAVS